jgi:transcriptional regulator with XRE-family HTH domain
MNTELITERRIAAGLTIRELARQTGVAPAVVVDLEWRRVPDAEQTGLSVTSLWRICAALDLTMAELLDDGPPASGDPPEPADDDIAVEAALVEHGGVLTRDDLAMALGWSLHRLERALLVLEQRLRPTGQRLRRVGWNSYALCPRLGALQASQRRDLHRAHSGRVALGPAVAFVLLGVVNGDPGRAAEWLYRLPQGDRNAVELLIRQGLIKRDDRNRLVPTADVSYSLHQERWWLGEDDEAALQG